MPEDIVARRASLRGEIIQEYDTDPPYEFELVGDEVVLRQLKLDAASCGYEAQFRLICSMLNEMLKTQISKKGRLVATVQMAGVLDSFNIIMANLLRSPVRK